MSYEGYREYLCANGHYGACDAYDDISEKCRCGASWAFEHSVDQTNGLVRGDPSTRPAPRKRIAIDDDWKTDRHGNRYAADVERFRPSSKVWTAIKAGQSA